MSEENIPNESPVEKIIIDENKVIQTIILGSDWQEVLSTLVSEETMDPMNIDLVKLAGSFMSYLQRLDKFDFRIPARFILVAAILLRMKTELLLEEEEKRQLRAGEQINPINLENIPPLTPPLVRTPTRKVTLTELIFALNKAFAFREKKESTKLRMRGAIERLIEPSEDVEARIDRIYKKVLHAQKITFREMMPEWKRSSIVEILLPLLHLSQRHMVTMDQKEMFQEIEIMILETPH